VQLRDAYAVLGVPPGLNSDEIRSRYRHLVKEMHPDVAAGRAGELGEIIEAYRLIDTFLARRKPTVRPRQRAAKPSHRPEKTKEQFSSDRTGRKERAGSSARAFFALGNIAIHGGDRTARCTALRRLVDSGKRSAAVFVRQCLFDVDPMVHLEAARLFPLVPGVRRETMLMEVVDQLTSRQCEVILDTIQTHSLKLRRFVAYAAADPRPRVRQRAMEVLSDK
jgi:hypothetical protein